MGKNNNSRAAAKSDRGARTHGAVADAGSALVRAREAAEKLKRKDAALYWAIVAQTMVLTEIRDEIRAANREPGSVTLPDEAPPRASATVQVTER